MNCEKAEEYLSAYLDGMLDPSLCQEVAGHLESCEQCRTVIEDYRRFDQMLASMPRVSPPDEVRARIFDSPELDEIVRKQRDRRSRGAAPPWTRIALESAAVVALLIGSALLVKQGLFHSQGITSTHPPLTIAGPSKNGTPLSAGSRAVYLRDGRLWSAPLAGSGLAQPLTPAGETVAGWAVSADHRMVAYIDARTGTIHVVRSDDQNDTAIGSIGVQRFAPAFWGTPAGKAIASGLAWTPDGSQIAYVAPLGTGTALHLTNADGTNNRIISGDGTSVISDPVWSGDSLRLAFLYSSSTNQQVAYYDTVGKKVTTLASLADALHPSAQVAQMAWLPSASNPGLTWSTAEKGHVTGIFSYLLLQGEVQRLTPDATQYAAADYTSARPDGAWVVATTGSAPQLSLLSPSGPVAQEPYAQLNGPVSALEWSPTGSTVAYIASNNAGIWEPGSPVQTIAHDASGQLAWSPNGGHLALLVKDNVLMVGVSGGTARVLTRLVQVPGPVELAWSTDSSGLAVASGNGLYVASLNGHMKLVDHTSLAGAMTKWTVAG